MRAQARIPGIPARQMPVSARPYDRVRVGMSHMTLCVRPICMLPDEVAPLRFSPVDRDLGEAWSRPCDLGCIAFHVVAPVVLLVHVVAPVVLQRLRCWARCSTAYVTAGLASR